MDNLELSNYQDIKEKIKTELNRVAQGFVEIGYRLKQVRDEELYKLDGYGSITEFAKVEYKLNQWDTSRFIAINDRYSADGSSPRLLEQYEGYGYSKLTEMLSLSEDELQLVSLQTTRAEIREIKLVKKEAENEENAPAHVSESLDSTQLQDGFDTNKKYVIPEADKLLIELFRDKSKRVVLKDLAALLSSSTSSNDVIAKAAELINPSGHLMHRKGFAIMMFEEDHIKYNRMGSPTVNYTYRDIINDLLMVFDMCCKDPWVAFYGEPEPEPEPEQPKKEPAPNKKEMKKPTVKPVAKKSESPQITQLEEDTEEDTEPEDTDDEQTEEQQDIIPGQKRIGDYPELTPEDHIETDIVCTDVEIVEADIVNARMIKDDLKVNLDEATGEIEVIIKGCQGIKLIRVINSDTGESWEVAIDQ